jgi:nucleoside-diphosphate-sugar epimerase
MDVAGYDEPVLVTGANGFIGSKVVETLLKLGFTRIRGFVRPSSRLVRLNEVLTRFPGGKDVELIKGDLLSREDCIDAAEGRAIIYHLAAGFDKSFAGAFMNSALTTRNLIEAFASQGRARRFVNVSSFAVYSNLHLKRGALLDESCPLEEASQERCDAYGFGKLKQEEIVREYCIKHQIPYVILRPGYVFGPGKRELNGRVGINTFGFFIHLGRSNTLPVTYVDNCAEAIVLAGVQPGIEGEVFNVVDDDLPTSADFLRAYKRTTGQSLTLSLPYALTYLACALWENYSRFSKGQLPPVFNRRRCAAEWKANKYSNRKLKERVGWQPQVRMKEATASFLAQFLKS